jgi:hypothetical protein
VTVPSIAKSTRLGTPPVTSICHVIDPETVAPLVGANVVMASFEPGPLPFDDEGSPFAELTLRRAIAATTAILAAIAARLRLNE